jgi:hypothetical protein
LERQALEGDLGVDLGGASLTAAPAERVELLLCCGKRRHAVGFGPSARVGRAGGTPRLIAHIV